MEHFSKIPQPLSQAWTEVIRIKFWMKYQILDFLTSTQILASWPNLLSTLLTVEQMIFSVSVAVDCQHNIRQFQIYYTF